MPCKTAFGKINEQSSTFASAAVPSVQAEVADRIYPLELHAAQRHPEARASGTAISTPTSSRSP